MAMAFAEDGRLIYELSMPLAVTETNKYAPDADPDNAVLLSSVDLENNSTSSKNTNTSQ